MLGGFGPSLQAERTLLSQAALVPTLWASHSRIKWGLGGPVPHHLPEPLCLPRLQGPFLHTQLQPGAEPPTIGSLEHAGPGAASWPSGLLAAALAVRRPQDSWAPPRAGRDPLVACPRGLPGSVGGVETAPLPAGHPAEPVPGGDAAAPRGAWQDPQFALGRKGWGVGLHGAHSPPAGDAAAPVGRGTSRATCGAAGQRSPWPPTPSPCSAWPARCPAASCTCTATTTCTGEGGR